MALCKDVNKLRESRSEAFEKVIRPGADVTYEGIYKCVGCGIEMAVVAGKPFPGSKQRPHARGCTQERWQLLVGLSHT
jgi:hypothetical protein